MTDERWRQVDSALLLWSQAAEAGLIPEDAGAIRGEVMSNNDVLRHARILGRLIEAYPEMHESLLSRVTVYEDDVRVVSGVLGEAVESP